MQMRVTETPVAQEHRLANLNVEAVSFVNVNLHTLDQSVNTVDKVRVKITCKYITEANSIS